MKHDRETGQTLFDFFKNIKAELRLGSGFELISAVACAYRNSKAVNACTLDKFLNLSRIGIACIFSGNIYIVFNAFKSSEFALNYNTVIMGIFNDPACECNLVFKGLMRTVDHYGCKSSVNAAFAQFKTVSVVEVDAYRQVCFNNSCFNKFH